MKYEKRSGNASKNEQNLDVLVKITMKTNIDKKSKSSCPLTNQKKKISKVNMFLSPDSLEIDEASSFSKIHIQKIDDLESVRVRGEGEVILSCSPSHPHPHPPSRYSSTRV